MSISSIHIENGSVDSIIHNERYFEIDYAIDTADRNEYLSIHNTAVLVAKAKLDFAQVQRPTFLKNGVVINKFKTMQKNTNLVKEAVINLNEEHTMTDLKLVADQLEEIGYKICHIAIHKDEGHLENDGTKFYNYHAHILMLNYDFKNHRTVRPSPGEMRKLQTDVATILKMERGKQYINTEKAGAGRMLEYEKNPENFTTIKKERLNIWQFKRMKKEESEKINVEKEKTNKIEKRLQEDKIAVNELARVFELRKLEKDKIYDPASLIKAIKKKYEDMRKQYIEEKGHSKADYDALKKERDEHIEKIKELDLIIKNQQAEIEALKASKEQEQEHIKKEPEEQEEQETTTAELEKIDKMYGEVTGLIEAGASAEELREVVKMHKQYEPKRPAYVTARSRAVTAYKSKLIKNQTKEENLLVSRDEEQLDNSTATHKFVKL